MATAKKAEKNDLYDVDSIPSTENSSAARIEAPGIHHNLKVRFEIAEGEYKNEEAKAASADGKWHGFQVTVTDSNGLELSEIYFMPPQKADDVKFLQKKFELADGKLVETREANPTETLKILNNEFLAYLLDLGEAMGFTNNTVKEHLVRNAKGFLPLCEAFIDKFKPSENTRISAKVLYNNSKTKQTSYLKLHGPYTVYYPYGNDLFDIYKEGRPTVLKMTDWEVKNGCKKMYTNDTDRPTGDGAVQTQEGFKASLGAEDDPF